MRIPQALSGVSRRRNSRPKRSFRSASRRSRRSRPRDRFKVMSWISRMVISSHRSERRIGQTRVGLTRCGASLDRPMRITTTPASSLVGTEKISSAGNCGSTQSRNTSFRRSANSAHLGIGDLSVATVEHSLIPSTKAPPCAFAKATASSSIAFLASLTIFLSVIHGSCPPAGRLLLNSICSPSGTSEEIKASISSMPTWSAGLESAPITGSFLRPPPAPPPCSHESPLRCRPCASAVR